MGLLSRSLRIASMIQKCIASLLIRLESFLTRDKIRTVCKSVMTTMQVWRVKHQRQHMHIYKMQDGGLMSEEGT